MQNGILSSLCVALVLIAASLARAEPPAAKPAAPWWLGSPAGVSREVLPPWTPVEAAGAAVKVWGRTYQFGTLPLPSDVVARNAKVLASPITLRGTADGKELTWAGPGCRLIESRTDAARLAGAAESGNLLCEGTATIEYDGMIRCDLRIGPKTGKATLQRLALEMPLDASHAAYLHFWPGLWGSIFNSGALPKEGYRGEFRPFFWLGDEWRGLAWFCESERNFFNAKETKPIEIERRGDRAVFRVNLVTAPQTIDHALDYTFGFQATPLKPATPDAWDYRICHYGDYGIEDQPYTPPGEKPTTLLHHLARSGVRTVCFHEHWTDIQAYPATTHGKELKKLTDACRRENIQLLLYLGHEISTLAPEWAEYSERCLVKPRAGGYKRAYQPQPQQTGYIVCGGSEWQDFIAAHLEKLVAEHAIGGVYLDGTSEPWVCSNTAHGCGYLRPDGSIGPTYPIFATRSLLKRIYTIVRKHDPQRAGQRPPVVLHVDAHAGVRHELLGRRARARSAAAEGAGHDHAAGRLPLRVHGPQLGRARRIAALFLGPVETLGGDGPGPSARRARPPRNHAGLERTVAHLAGVRRLRPPRGRVAPVLGKCPVRRQSAGQREGEPLQPARQRLRGRRRQHDQRKVSGRSDSRSGRLEAADDAGGP